MEADVPRCFECDEKLPAHYKWCSSGQLSLDVALEGAADNGMGDAERIARAMLAKAEAGKGGIDPITRGLLAALDEARSEAKAYAVRDERDPAAADAATAEGIQKVERGIDREWLERAKVAWRKLLEERAILTPDELWTVIEKPREPRASSAVMTWASRERLMEPTGEYVKSKMPTQHNNLIREYRSLLYVGAMAGVS